MAAAWNSESDREAMLRRAAIVLSSLPSPLASKLLGSFPPEAKEAIRQSIGSLSDVDPLERRRALHAFKVSLQQPAPDSKTTPASPSMSRVVSSDDLLSLSADSGTPAQSPPPPVATNVAPGLQFLTQVDDNTLVHLLSVEHPQAVALVLASIAPEQAARILPRLDSRLQSDAMSRISRLDEIPEAAATEIADHFRARLAQQATPRHDTTGRRALDAILAAMPSSPAAKTDAPIATTDTPPASEIPPAQASPSAEDQLRQSVSAVTFPSSDVPAIDLSHKLRVAEETWPEEQHPTAEHDQSHDTIQRGTPILGEPKSTPRTQPLPESEPEPVTGTSNAVPPAQSRNELGSTDEIHQHLLRLSPAALCQALGRVETRQAMLALCGLPTEVSEAALAILPRAHAKKVRVAMNSLGNLHLREIDDAKETVALASLESEPTASAIPVAA